MVHGPALGFVGSFSLRTRSSASSSFSMADSPSSGYAECAIFPLATNSTRSVPFDASASLFSVGSPLMRNFAPRGCWLATCAPWLSRSSPTRNSSPT